MKRCILLLIVLSFSTFFAFAASDTPDELLEKAIKAYNLHQNKKAFSLFTMAKDAGEYDALAYLGDMYSLGKYVKEDTKKCKELFEEGVSKGSVLCMNRLGVYYYLGLFGDGRNYSEAEKYLTMAAFRGDETVQVILGMLYDEYGDKAMRDCDYRKAGLWYKASAINGNSEALKEYKKVTAKGYTISDEEARHFVQRSYQDRYPAESPSKTDFVSPVAEIDNTEVNDSRVNNIAVKKSAVDSSIPSTGVVADNTFAVIIANENYTSVSKVNYAANDGEVFSQYCHKTLGIPENHILMKTDATFGAIESLLARIEKIGSAYEGDINIIFYYAGHGIPDEKTRDSFIIPVDGDGSLKSTCVKTSSVYRRLADINAKSVVVFMDACFSGSARGDAMLASARGVRMTPKEETIGGRMVVFTASHGDETAYPYDEQGHGLFTYFLLKKLQETSGKVKLGDMMDYVQSSVKRESIVNCGQIQTPSVFFSDKSSDWREWQLR